MLDLESKKKYAEIFNCSIEEVERIDALNLGNVTIPINNNDEEIFNHLKSQNKDI